MRGVRNDVSRTQQFIHPKIDPENVFQNDHDGHDDDGELQKGRSPSAAQGGKNEREAAQQEAERRHSLHGGGYRWKHLDQRKIAQSPSQKNSRAQDGGKRPGSQRDSSWPIDLQEKCNPLQSQGLS